LGGKKRKDSKVLNFPGVGRKTIETGLGVISRKKIGGPENECQRRLAVGRKEIGAKGARKRERGSLHGQTHRKQKNLKKQDCSQRSAKDLEFSSE